MKYEVKTTLKHIPEYVSTGNEKLKSNAKVLFLIWNIPAQITCPYATDHCTKFCYAKKAETMYPDCLPCREKNLKLSMSDSFVTDMINLISIKLNHLKNGRVIRFRIHESGDFYSRAYVQKWLQIIRYFADDDRIRFMAYTKSVYFFRNVNLSEYKNFVLRFSLWDDTDIVQENTAYELGLPTYTALSEEDLAKEIPNSYTFCDCIDCGTCLKCYNANIKRIICLIH